MNRNIVVNIGEQRFYKLREQNSLYIDKTEFIREWWETGATSTLITRPRRFGKTLNMNMLECFFSNEYAGRSDLFEGLSIWENGSQEEREKYRQLQGTYPVISLSFAEIKAAKYEEMTYKIKRVIADLYDKNRRILEGTLFGENEKEYYKNVNSKMKDEDVADTVRSMANFMKRHFDKDVIILLDEYDTPMQEAWLNGYWDQAVQFFWGFLGSTFKTNPYLQKGVITGITRISKESIFSDLNNLEAITTTSNHYATAFGFTEEEVFAALDATGLGSEKQEVKRWYDGFTFGSCTDIYNPWSIASFIRNGGEYDAYWANTSGNGLVNALVQRGNVDIKQSMEELLQGKSITARIDEQIVFHQLDDNVDAVWSLLLATGYLKVLTLKNIGGRKKKYTLKLTNVEVQDMFEDMVKGWFDHGISLSYNAFIKALLINDVDAMNEYMNKVAMNSFSNFDTAKSASDDDAPERFYHGFVLGLMVELADRYQITSNRESGFGRYDIMLKPSDKEKDCAYIIEFKVYKPKKEKSLEETVANALSQIEEKQYETTLIAEGFAPGRIRKYGFAFKGKECLIG